MKLHEIIDVDLSTRQIVEYLVPNSPTIAALDESAMVGALHIASIIKSNLTDFAKILKIVYSSNNRKSQLNDKVIGDLYQRELKKLNAQIDILPQKAQAVIRKFATEKFGIKFSGVDLSRENGKRVLLVALLRTIVLAAEKFSDIDTMIVTIVSLMTGTGFITKAITVLFNSKDLKQAIQGSFQIITDLIGIFKKANEQHVNNSNTRGSQ